MTRHGGWQTETVSDTWGRGLDDPTSRLVYVCVHTGGLRTDVSLLPSTTSGVSTGAHRGVSGVQILRRGTFPVQPPSRRTYRKTTPCRWNSQNLVGTE